MGAATSFLLGGTNPQGRTVETILAADDDWLEDRHDWVQWAFPSRERSAFNDQAPVWTADEARALPEEGRENIRRLLVRFRAFLDGTDWWRRGSDHNHARISRVLRCLRDVGLTAEADAFYRYVTDAPEPGMYSRHHWRLAMSS